MKHIQHSFVTNAETILLLVNAYFALSTPVVNLSRRARVVRSTKIREIYCTQITMIK